MKKKNHPGVYIPPPLIYVVSFGLSFLAEAFLPIEHTILHTIAFRVIGIVLIVLYIVLAFPALWTFFKTKNTLVTIKPASSLQTRGIFSLSRNPMYLSLVFLYCGIAVFEGNWWTFILAPFLILIIQVYVIKREELYLYSEFGEAYLAYRKKVRRWL